MAMLGDANAMDVEPGTKDVTLSASVLIRIEKFTHADLTVRWRPIMVVATKISLSRSRRVKGICPIALQYTAGNGSTVEDARPKDMEYGHLVALHLGGIDMNRPENLVPMNAGVNKRGKWRVLERKLKGQHKLIKSITMSIKYDYGDGRIPSSFRVTCTTTAAKGKSKEEKERIGNPQYVTPSIQPIDADFRSLVQTNQAGFASSGWTMNAYAQSQNSPMGLPVTPGPYAILDYLKVNGLLNDGTTMGGGRDFGKKQKEFILQLNAIRNGGNLKTDALSDPEQGNLSKMGNDTFPEIDHIEPRRGRNGSNAYSNAQVISGRYNRKLSNKPDPGDEGEDDSDSDEESIEL